MTNFYFLLGATFCLLIGGSCTNEKPKKVPAVETVENAAITFNTENLDTLSGTYMGDFGGSDIRIVITHIGKNHVVGYNLLKGLRRNINGTYTNLGDTIKMLLNEPGDNEYDGVFDLEIYRNDFTGKGNWKSNSGKVTAKNFKLEKLPPFEYAEDLDKLNNSNFASIFYMVEDSLGSIYFDNNGSCVYEYYPELDHKNRIEQKVEIRGSWVYKNKLLKVNWEENSVFPGKQSTFKPEKEEYSVFLTGEERTFYIVHY